MARGTWRRGQFGQSGQNWANKYAQAGANLIAGVANPKRSPTEAAIANVNNLISGFNSATSGGSQSLWAQNLRKAGDAGWANGMKDYANTGLASKAQKGGAHYAAYAANVGPQVMQAASQLPARGPAGTNGQRSQGMQDWLHGNRGKFRKLWRG
jgi:hypothetical protein